MHMRQDQPSQCNHFSPNRVISGESGGFDLHKPSEFEIRWELTSIFDKIWLDGRTVWQRPRRNQVGLAHANCS